MPPSSQAIRDLNDRFRAGDRAIAGRIMVTIGVQELIANHEGSSLADVIRAVREFDSFTRDNDPYGEHDFGGFAFLAKKLFWKIDYYAPDLEHGSEDPADVSLTVRVLTIMLAEEY